MDFLVVFHMIWKNNESGEPRLVGFWVNRHSKMQRISAKKFFVFLRCHYEFTNYFDILNLFFLMSYQEKLQPGKIYLPRISTSRNIKLKNCKIQFFSIFGWFFRLKCCPQYLLHIEHVPIKCPKQFLYYIELICRRACA